MSRLLKPPPWDWNAASLPEEWQSIAEDLHVIIPAWHPRFGTPVSNRVTVGDATLDSYPTESRYVRSHGTEGGNPEFILQQHGPAYLFPSSPDRQHFISASDKVEFSDTNEFAIVTFLYRNETGDDLHDVAGLWDRDNPTLQQYLLAFFQDRASLFVKQAGDVQAFVQASTSSNLRWVTVGAQANKATGRLEIFVDGQLAGTEPYNGTLQSIPFINSVLTWGGRRNSLPKDHFNGRVSTMYLWGRSLSETEHRRLAEEPFGIITPQWWTPAFAPTTVGPVTGEAILQGVGTVTADGQTTATGAADLTGTGTLTADGTIGIPTGQAALTGTGILVADGTAIVPIVGEADLVGVGILTAQSLPPLSILSIRQLLAEGIRQSLHLAGRDDVAVYEYPPETVVVPSVVIMPDEPYWQPSNFGRSPLERIRVNLELQMLTPRLEMSESFNDLERLGGIVLQGTLRVPVVQWTEMGQPEGVTVNDIETIMTRASVMAHV